MIEMIDGTFDKTSKKNKIGGFRSTFLIGG